MSILPVHINSNIVKALARVAKCFKTHICDPAVSYDDVHFVVKSMYHKCWTDLLVKNITMYYRQDMKPGDGAVLEQAAWKCVMDYALRMRNANGRKTPHGYRASLMAMAKASACQSRLSISSGSAFTPVHSVHIAGIA
jgi:hypothetical protein